MVLSLALVLVGFPSAWNCGRFRGLTGDPPPWYKDGDRGKLKPADIKSMQTAIERMAKVEVETKRQTLWNAANNRKVKRNFECWLNNAKKSWVLNQALDELMGEKGVNVVSVMRDYNTRKVRR